MRWRDPDEPDIPLDFWRWGTPFLEWTGGAESYRDMCDEYQWNGTWKYQAVVRESTCHRLRLLVELHVSSCGRKRRRPGRCSANLRLGNHIEPLEMPRKAAGSIAQAKRWAEALDIWAASQKLLREAYSRRGSTALYRKEGEAWVPYMTQLNITYHDTLSLPMGHYFSVRPYHLSWSKEQGPYCDLRGGHTERSYWGSSGGGRGDSDRIARELGHWALESP